MKLKYWRDPDAGCLSCLLWLAIILGIITFMHFIIVSILFWILNLMVTTPLIIPLKTKWVIAFGITIIRILLECTK